MTARVLTVRQVVQVTDSRAYHWPRGCVIDDHDITDQVPYCGGLLVPGNFAYLWADVRPLTTPVPYKGGPGLRHATPELLQAVVEQVS